MSALHAAFGSYLPNLRRWADFRDVQRLGLQPAAGAALAPEAAVAQVLPPQALGAVGTAGRTVVHLH